MAEAIQVSQIQPMRWERGLVAGIGAGVAAALVAVALGSLMHVKILPPVAIAGSAFVAGVLGGLVYAGLSRVTSRPATALWVVTLALATIDSLLIISLPFAAGIKPPLAIYGLVEPLARVAALAGLGRFGQGHFPAAYLAADTVLHYATAVIVSLLVPWWAKPKD